jgi:tRNA threonylcarbamoyladenosine biosynthesis protein TsaE
MNLNSPGARSKRNEFRQRVLSTRSPDETQDLGFRLAQELTVPCVVLLIGALGSGKTTLTRGLASGLGLEDAGLVNSPSFTLVNTYPGRCPIYHVDLYRLEGDRDIYSVGLDDFLGKQGVTIIEWGDRLPDPEQASMIVELEDAGEESRVIRVFGPVRSKS